MSHAGSLARSLSAKHASARLTSSSASANLLHDAKYLARNVHIMARAVPETRSARTWANSISDSASSRSPRYALIRDISASVLARNAHEPLSSAHHSENL